MWCFTGMQVLAAVAGVFVVGFVVGLAGLMYAVMTDETHAARH